MRIQETVLSYAPQTVWVNIDKFANGIANMSNFLFGP